MIPVIGGALGAGGDMRACPWRSPLVRGRSTPQVLKELLSITAVKTCRRSTATPGKPICFVEAGLEALKPRTKKPRTFRGLTEREKGFEPSTLALARRCSTTELFPQSYSEGGLYRGGCRGVSSLFLPRPEGKTSEVYVR